MICTVIFCLVFTAPAKWRIELRAKIGQYRNRCFNPLSGELWDHKSLVNHFYAPGLKGPPGASSVWIVRPSVRLSVRLSVCSSVRPSVRNSVPLSFKVQYLKFGWSYSNQTWTVSSSKGCSHFTDITCPWGWGGVKIWDLEILPYFDFVAAGGIRDSQTHV